MTLVLDWTDSIIAYNICGLILLCLWHVATQPVLAVACAWILSFLLPPAAACHRRQLLWVLSPAAMPFSFHHALLHAGVSGWWMG